MKHLPLMGKMISYKDGRIISHPGLYYRPWLHYPVFSDELQQIIREAKREDIAAAAQRHLENIVVSMAEYYLKKTGLNHVCMAGGVFANVSLNKKIILCFFRTDNCLSISPEALFYRVLSHPPILPSITLIHPISGSLSILDRD